MHEGHILNNNFFRMADVSNLQINERSNVELTTPKFNNFWSQIWFYKFKTF